MRICQTGFEQSCQATKCILIGYMKWSGVKNGELLELAADAGFDAVLTNDRGFEHEQNLDALPIAVVLLLVETNTIESIRPLYDQLLSELEQLQPRKFVKLSATRE